MNSRFKASILGFTLIELLVVVSIISLLTSIVLASISVARARADDSAIKTNLHSVVNGAELYFSSNGSYGTAFAATTFSTAKSCPSQGFLADAQTASAIGQSLGLSANIAPACAIGTGGQSWAVSVPLTNNGSWCVSSGGVSVLGGYANGGGTLPADCSGSSTPPPDSGGGGGGGGGSGPGCPGGPNCNNPI